MAERITRRAPAWDEPRYRIELDPTEDSATIYLDNIYICDPVAVANLAIVLRRYEDEYDLTISEAINDLIAGKALGRE